MSDFNLTDETPLAPSSSSAPERWPFWGYLDLLIFLGSVLGVLLVVIIALSGLIRLVSSLATREELIIKVRYGRPLWLSLGMVPSRFPLWQAILGGCLLSFAVGFLGTTLKIQQDKSPFDRFFHSPAWVIVFGVFAVFLGPLFEEIVFRGFIQPLLTRDLGNVSGIFITAFTFGLLHGPEYAGKWEIQFVFLITLVGVCLGIVRVLGRSLVPSIFMHAGFNAVFFIAAIAQNQIGK